MVGLTHTENFWSLAGIRPAATLPSASSHIRAYCGRFGSPGGGEERVNQEDSNSVKRPAGGSGFGRAHSPLTAIQEQKRTSHSIMSATVAMVISQMGFRRYLNGAQGGMVSRSVGMRFYSCQVRRQHSFQCKSSHTEDNIPSKCGPDAVWLQISFETLRG